MRRDAKKWANSIVRKYIDDNVTNSKNINLIEDWNEFKKKL
jgi:hypothetical protein